MTVSELLGREEAWDCVDSEREMTDEMLGLGPLSVRPLSQSFFLSSDSTLIPFGVWEIGLWGDGELAEIAKELVEMPEESRGDGELEGTG